MSVSLVKGQKINLSKEVEGLSKVVVGLGWDAAKKGLFGQKQDIDCDASAIVLGANNSYRGVAYYGERKLESGCVYHHGDNLTGDGDGDDEQITVDLKKMPSSVEKVVFVVNIYNCESRKQDFGMIKNAFIRLVDETTGKEICKYNLSENYSGKTAMVFAEVYKKDNEWRFNAIGQGTTDKSISEMARKYK
ncbi:MAG: TerD family protein [Lachnospiraceae bacterium]|nr:TerD family protein [Lachnospiraceae bacterium]